MILAYLCLYVEMFVDQNVFQSALLQNTIGSNYFVEIQLSLNVD